MNNKKQVYSQPDCLLRQQLGYDKINTYDSCFKRLRCTEADDFSCIWGNARLPDENQGESPTFACKFATKQGANHLLAMADEDGKLVIQNTMKRASAHGEQVHHNAIFDLAWLSESLKLITVSGDHTARLVDTESMQTERMFIGHTRSVKAVTARDDDPSTFATGSRDGSIRIWDTRCANASNLFIQSDRIISNSHCKTTPTSSSKRRRPASLPVTAANSVTSLVFQDSTTLISCGSGDGLIKVWDLRKTYTTRAMHEIAYSGGTMRNGFSHLMVDKHRRRLYANCLDNTIYCYNVSAYHQQPVMEYRGLQNSSFYIKSAMSKDGKYIISGSTDHNAYIWNTNNSHPIVKLCGHSAEVTCVAWRQTGDMMIVTCSDDVRHKFWRVGNEILPENWEIEGRGVAEMGDYSSPKTLRLVRQQSELNENTPKSAKIEPNKRPLEDEDLPDAKRSGRRLFEQETEASGSSACQYAALAVILEEDAFKTPKASAIQQIQHTPEAINSPTANLPNFVVDGSAPHLHFSPQKKPDKDWLTKIRVERQLVKEMQDLASGPSSPKMPRLQEQSPSQSQSLHHKTPKRRNSRAGSHGPNHRQSPILNFFRVTNTSILNNSQCSPKSSLISNNSSPLRTAE